MKTASFLSLFILAAIACGGSTSSEPGVTTHDSATPNPDASVSASADGGDTTTPVDAGTDAKPDATTNPGCGDITLDAPSITGHSVAEVAPTAAGGTIADGTYFVTDLTAYVGPTGPVTDLGTESGGFIMSGGGTSFVGKGGDGTKAPEVVGGTITTSGTDVKFNYTCGAGGQSSPNAFTATGSTISLFFSTPTTLGTLVMTLTRQP